MSGVHILFLVFSILVIALAAFGIRKYAAKPKLLTLGLVLWLSYTTALSLSGIFTDEARRPPGLVFFLIPFAIYIVWLCRSNVAREFARAVPLQILIGIQSFRILVEIFLDQYWQAGLLPKMMTYHGLNFDIFIGASALLIWLAWSKVKNSSKILKIWNFAGLLVLANVVIRGILNAPGPQRYFFDDVPNLAVVTFPSFYIAGVMVPLAVTLHILAIRQLNSEK